MQKTYKKIADGYKKLAEGYRELAENDGKELEPETKEEVSIEDVRAVFAEKSQAGKRKELKDLLLKYGSGNVSGVDPKDLPALLKEAEAL